MKSILSVLSSIFICYSLNAQTFVVGEVDPSGDATQQLSPDLKIIYHATDMADDSIWFKMEFYQRVDNVAWNVKIGIDNNSNPADGGTWPGTNQSMKFDMLADIYSNPGFPPPYGNLLDENGNYISSSINISFPDTATVIFGIRLSDILPSGNSFNYIAGTGIVAGLVNDDIPDSGMISALATVGIDKTIISSEIAIYPNPANEIIYLQSNLSFQLPCLPFNLYDSQGIIVKSGIIGRAVNTIDIESLREGIYYLLIVDDKEVQRLKFIKAD